MTHIKPVVLVVDDMPDNLALASVLLKNLYKVKVATDGQKALAIAAADPPDLILLDVMMPGIDGYETCRRLKEQAHLADIPVIFLTAKDDPEDEEKGFQLGAVDYIVKPLTPSLLLARVKTHLTLKLAQDYLKDRNSYLESEIARRIEEVTLLQDVAIMAMASLAETRDHETSSHIHRTALYVKTMALKLKNHPSFADTLSLENIYLMTKSAPLHDIGKIGIPDMILWKPAKLTAEEFELIKKHPAIGRDAIIRAETLIKGPESFLRFAKEMAYFHHEKWDGSGYPKKLSGDKIPVSARLMALADVYDALISRRVYKDPIPHTAAVSIIKAESGRHFDPAVVDAFLTLADRFKDISETYRDIL
ncbi:MAG: two-component system response regulator [Anaerolineaceae bacterium]|nr:two-component system response regulator [Anaerolineaceae bacterium]